VVTAHQVIALWHLVSMPRLASDALGEDAKGLDVNYHMLTL
jgi:hypothetical protein